MAGETYYVADTDSREMRSAVDLRVVRDYRSPTRCNL